MGKIVYGHLKPESVQRYIDAIGDITQRYFAAEFDDKDSVIMFPLVHKYTFNLACRFFLSIEDPDLVAQLDLLPELAAGLISLPVDFPGTQFNKSIKASRKLRKVLVEVIRQRKADLGVGKATTTQDMLSNVLMAVEEQGLPSGTDELVAADLTVALLISGFDDVNSCIAMTCKYLAEFPQVYDLVYREQMEIAKSKAPGEFLNWEDIQKMKYTWNVYREVMRLAPPASGLYREAMDKFTYAGYTIPKGWKVLWSSYSTHMNPNYFPEPEKFDPTQFEGQGPDSYTYVAFGGGQRMCPGRDYARLVTLVFLHNLVKRFKWEKLVPNEQVIVTSSPRPEKGLPVRLILHDENNKKQN